MRSALQGNSKTTNIGLSESAETARDPVMSISRMSASVLRIFSTYEAEHSHNADFGGSDPAPGTQPDRAVLLEAARIDLTGLL